MVALTSEWGGGHKIAVSGAVTAPTGERLKLNPTGDGIRVWYTDPYDSQQKVMDVALADQRGFEIWTLASVGIPALSNVTASDAYDPNTAKYNTQAIIDYIDQNNLMGTFAVFNARTSTIGGVSCNLPNKQQLEIIWKVREIIDGLDSTAASNPTYKLSNWGFGESSTACWSSSEYSNNFAWGVNDYGAVFTHTKSYVFGVIPILELDPVTLQPI